MGVARTGVLTGATPRRGPTPTPASAHAWETYRVLAEVLDDVEADPPGWALLTTSQVPAPAALPPIRRPPWRRPAPRSMRRSHASGSRAWATLAPRVGGTAGGGRVGDAASERTATALAGPATDPFAVTEADAAAEQAAAASGSKRAAAQAAVALSTSTWPRPATPSPP